MSDQVLTWADTRASLAAKFGEYNPGERAKDAAGDEIMKVISALPLNATLHQVASALDVLEREKPFLFRKFSEQDEVIFARLQDQNTEGMVFGVTKTELAKLSPNERLALANSKGATIPAWLRIARQKGGRQ